MPYLSTDPSLYDAYQLLNARCPSCEAWIVWRRGTYALRLFASCCVWTIEAKEVNELYEVKVRKIQNTKNLSFIAPRIARRGR